MTNAPGSSYSSYHQWGTAFDIYRADGKMLTMTRMDSSRKWEKFVKTWVPVQEPENWVHDTNGWWYRNADGSWPTMCWKLINHHWYLFGAYGYALTGWVQWDGQKTGSGDWYYLEESGEFQRACWHGKPDGSGALERWCVE